MTVRPEILDATLIERLTLDDDAFLEFFLDMASNIAPREWTPEAFARGLRYPWRRPQASYRLRNGIAEPIGATVPPTGAGRVPLLAFGSNSAPRNLALKLAHLERAEDREVLVLTGWLHDLDVVAAASVTLYGAMPATLASSPGTRVRTAVLLVNATQLTTLTWGEMPYRLGRLPDTSFVADEDVALGAPLAYVSRWGAFAPQGEPAPLAAISAERRCWRAWQQRDLLDRAATMTFAHGDAEMLSRAIFADYASVSSRVLRGLRDHAQSLALAGWEPLF